MNCNEFCHDLGASFGSVEALLHEHILEFGELLPHVFFGELTRFLLSECPEAFGIIACLEAAFASDNDSIQELIAVSFIENVETVSDWQRLLDGAYAPNLDCEWHRQHLDDGV